MKIPTELSKFNLEYAKKPVRRRLVMTGEGGPACGKTRLFYATAPRPALAIQLDMNDEGIREKCSDDILFKNVVVPPFTKHDEAQRAKDMLIAREVQDLYSTAVRGDFFRSIMIDEGAALYTLARRSWLVNLDFGGESQQSYAPINAYMARFFTLAKQHRINLYIPHRQKDEREKGAGYTPATGNKVYAGWKDALYESQIHLILSKDLSFNPLACAKCGMTKAVVKGKRCTCDKFVKANSVDRFEAYIAKCTANEKIEGMMLIGDDINWPTLGQLVYPHSEEDDWK